LFTYIWLNINGTDIADTNGRIETKSNTSDSLPIVPYVLNLNVGDAVSFVSKTSSLIDGHCQLLFLPANIGPVVPSIIVGIKQIAADIGTTGTTGLQGIQGETGPTGYSGTTGPTGPLGTGPTGYSGTTGTTGTQGPTGQQGPTGISNYSGTSYRDTTTLTFVQNNGTVYYRAALTSSLGSLTNYNELGTMLNVPNVSFTYMAIIYAYNGTPGSVNFGVVDFSNNPIYSTSLNGGPISTDINNPAVLEFTFPTAITTATLRPLRIAIWGGSIGETDYVSIRTVVLGYK
jgi:hypothetical protein